VPEGKIATGKLAQALMHGARVVALRGNFDQALTVVRELAATHPVSLVNSVNEYRIEGQKTGAFEVVDALGEAPDVLCIPVGNAGNVTAWWRGFSEVGAAPALHGYQAAGAAPLVHGAPVAAPETVASAIRIGNPARWEDAMGAFTASRGAVRAGGSAIGLLPGLDRAAANPWLTVALPTGLGELRNGLVVRAADAVIAVGGAYGTLSEIALALKAGRPVVGVGSWPIEGVIAAAGGEDAVSKALAALGAAPDG